MLSEINIGKCRDMYIRIFIMELPRGHPLSYHEILYAAANSQEITLPGNSTIQHTTGFNINNMLIRAQKDT